MATTGASGANAAVTVTVVMAIVDLRIASVVLVTVALATVVPVVLVIVAPAIVVLAIVVLAAQVADRALDPGRIQVPGQADQASFPVDPARIRIQVQARADRASSAADPDQGQEGQVTANMMVRIRLPSTSICITISAVLRPL